LNIDYSYDHSAPPPSRRFAWLAIIAGLVLSCGCLAGIVGAAGINLFSDLERPHLSYTEIIASAQATLNGTPFTTRLTSTPKSGASYPSLTPPAWPSPTPSATPSLTPASVEPIQRLNPQAFIQQYYDLINKRQYAKSFSMLSDGFKRRNHCCKPDGSFDDGPYKEWWNSIKKVEVMQVRVKKWERDLAVVEVKLRYNRMDGYVIESWTIFNLVGDPDGKSWLFE
jgi:hypothetical protein